jgi:hypothetical protein
MAAAARSNGVRRPADGEAEGEVQWHVEKLPKTCSTKQQRSAP